MGNGGGDRQAARRAHTVRGHLRRLVPGRRSSAQAAAAASEHGIILPAGHTFVRPHVRGRAEHQTEGAATQVRAVARGLRSVAALLHGKSG